MGATKQKWLFPLLVLAELFLILALIPANCTEEAADKDPPATREVCVLPRNNYQQQTCAEDNDCPSDSVCVNGLCSLGTPNDDYEEEYDDLEEIDATVQTTFVRRCEDAYRDCGCGYECLYGECHKLTSPYCCANADCGPGLVCAWEGENLSSGECLPRQCDVQEDCDDKCGTRCENNRCAKIVCCSDADCSDGKLCSFFGSVDNWSSHGNCHVPECTSNADCGCGKACSDKSHTCEYYSELPIKCCGTDFYYAPAKACLSREYIENGNCLDDWHCPAGKTCHGLVCMISTCASNADCGCEAVCRKGRCREGCDDNSGCCDENFPVCDRGQCVDPNAPDEDY